LRTLGAGAADTVALKKLRRDPAPAPAPAPAPDTGQARPPSSAIPSLSATLGSP
jgi:hypothetical protein